MKVRRVRAVFVFFLLVAMATLVRCTSPEAVEPSEAGSHSHGGTTHTHAEDEPSIAVTFWSEELELFMEYPVLEVGKQVRFAVHLTKLADFRPISEGPVLFRFAKDGTQPKMVTVGAPEVPGIFGPTLTFEEAGDYTLHLDILSDEIETSLEYGPIAVSESAEQMEPEQVQASAENITYLKDQQWKLPFASATVREREIYEIVRIPATIRAKPGSESVVTPVVGGRYEPPEGGIPILGAKIVKGDLLGYLELLPADRSSLLDRQLAAGMTITRLSEDVAKAEAEVAIERARLGLAEQEVARVTSLVEAEALPEKRLLEAQSALEIRRASLEAAQQALATYGKAISRYDSTGQTLDAIEGRLPLPAPISGQLVGNQVVPGQYVDDRHEIFHIVDLKRVWAQGQVFEEDLPRLENLRGGTLVLPGLAEVRIDQSALVFVGSSVNPANRTLPIYFEVENRSNRIKLGSLGRLDLQAGSPVEVLAIPKSALLVEEDRSVAYVQVAGETFERRLLRTGLQDQGWIQIVGGLEKGERVVILGAYNVALAARSTEVPDHGHVH